MPGMTAIPADADEFLDSALEGDVLWGNEFFPDTTAFRALPCPARSVLWFRNPDFPGDCPDDCR